MTRYARWTEVGLGAFFIVSAAAKAVNMDGFAVQVSAYNVVKEPALVQFSAYAAVVVETILGALLLAPLRLNGWTHMLSGGMIAVYSTLIAYAWVFHGLTDCGCLGSFVTLGPAASLAKNAVLMGLFGFAWYGTRSSDAPSAASGWLPRTAIIGAVAVLALAVFDGLRTGPAANVLQSSGTIDKDRPFAQFQFSSGDMTYDLGEGDYLVALLNSTCDHCKASVPRLNNLAADDGLPEMVALMMGTDDELTDFLLETLPDFETQLIDRLVFMQFIGSAPPRLVHVRDGRSVHHWDWDDEAPSIEEVASAVGGDERSSGQTASGTSD